MSGCGGGSFWKGAPGLVGESVLDCGFWFQVGRYQVGTWVGDNRPESDVHVGGNSVDIQVK